jgi:hypothetical protein
MLVHPGSFTAPTSAAPIDSGRDTRMFRSWLSRPASAYDPAMPTDVLAATPVAS